MRAKQLLKLVEAFDLQVSAQFKKRENLQEDFYHQARTKLMHEVRNELNGDLEKLSLRGMKHHRLSQELSSVVGILEHLIGNIQPNNSYAGIRELIDWIKKHENELKSLQISLNKAMSISNSDMPIHTPRGIPSLLNAIDHFAKFVMENPPNSERITYRPPSPTAALPVEQNDLTKFH